MNDKRAFGRAVDRWLDDGSDATPAEVIDAVLLAVRSTPQERNFRISWRTSPMKRLGYAVAAVAALAVGVAALSALSPRFGIGSGPMPTATVQQTPSPSTSAWPSPSGFSRFTSMIHGISIDYPAGWQIRRATEPWTEGELNFDSPAADVIFHPTLGERLYIALASRPSGGTQADQFDLLDKAHVCTGGGGGSFTVDGASALDWFCGSREVAITTDHRGYLILLVVSGDEQGLRETYDWAWIEAELETVDLRPEEAVDTETGQGGEPVQALHRLADLLRERRGSTSG